MKRFLPGLVLALVWLALLLKCSYLIFWGVALCIAAVAGSEYLKMVIKKDVPLVERTLLIIFLILPVFLAGNRLETGVSGGLFLSFFLVTLYVLFRYAQLHDPFDILMKLGFGSLYIGFLTAHLVLLRLLPEGNYWLIILVAITAGSDSGAYYSGSRFGKHKLCPLISPKKSIEGAVGGMVSGACCGFLFSYLLLGEIRWGMLGLTSLLLVIAGIFGDLCESALKRGMDIKDSGRILLGHGGVLDRIDSLLFAAPLLYYLYVFTG